MDLSFYASGEDFLAHYRLGKIDDQPPSADAEASGMGKLRGKVLKGLPGAEHALGRMYVHDMIGVLITPWRALT